MGFRAKSLAGELLFRSSVSEIYTKAKDKILKINIFKLNKECGM